MGSASDRPFQGKRKRCRRYNEPGHAHTLTFCCFRCQPFLTRERSRHWTLEAIDKARRTHRFDLWAYVLMPEHVHIRSSCRPPPSTTSAASSTLKGSVAKRAVAFVRASRPPRSCRALTVFLQPNGRRCIRFWQRGGGYDRNLWEPRYIGR